MKILFLHLEEKNVSFEVYDDMPGLVEDKGIYEHEGTKLAWFKDSEGNVLNIFSLK